MSRAPQVRQQVVHVALVERAFHFSDSAHVGQFRKSGEPYITHPLAVASILSQWRLDAHGLSAALLHDAFLLSGSGRAHHLDHRERGGVRAVRRRAQRELVSKLAETMSVENKPTSPSLIEKMKDLFS